MRDEVIATAIVKDMIRIAGDVKGSKFPYLFGPISGPSALEAMHAIFDELPREIQEEIQPLHPRNVTNRLNVTTDSSEPDMVAFWKLMVTNNNILSDTIGKVSTINFTHDKNNT